MTTFSWRIDILELLKHNAFWEKHEFYKIGSCFLMSTAVTQQYFVSNSHQQYSIKENNNPSTPTKGNMEKPNCSACLSRFLEFRTQVIHSMTIEYQRILTGHSVPALDSLRHIIYQTLRLNDHDLVGTVNGKCLYCEVHIEHLKKTALEVVQTQFNPFLRNMNPHHLEKDHQQQLFDRQQMISRGETTDSINGQRIPGVNNTVGSNRGQDMYNQQSDGKSHYHPDSAKSPSSTPASHFFAEAARMYNIQNKKNKTSSTSSSSSNSHRSKPRRRSDGLFPTNFSHILQHNPPANPPGLFKYMGRRVDGKVSVMLRIQQPCDMEQSDSFIEVDQRKKHVSVLQNLKSSDGHQPQQQSQPKLFGFDQIFEPELSQARVSSGSLLDVLHAVINGGDGALVTYGGPSTGKTHTMVGSDDSNATVGVLPCAISWLYSLINDCKERISARISVRVSAVEVVGKNETLKDLLAEQTSETDSIDSSGASPGIYLREDPVGGSIQIDNVSEPQAATAEKAGFYLDAALASRTTEKDNHGHVQRSHMIFTFHIYQYRVEKNVRRGPGGSVPYSGGRSRLHLIDLSYVNQNFEDKTNTAPSHAALGQIIIAMLNGHKKIPVFRDSKISRLLKDSIGNPTCRATLLAHVSPEEKQYRKTLQTLTTTSKIARTRRKKNKNCSSSSDNNSCDEGKQRYRLVNPIYRNNCLEDNQSDYVSSSAGEGEDSCDTVIYNGGNGHISDRDLTDNERPPSPNTIKIMKLKLASSSEDEMTEPVDIAPEKKNSTTNNLRAKLSSMEEGETDSNLKEQLQPPSTGEQTPEPLNTSVTKTSAERAVNVVAPLVVVVDKEHLDRVENSKDTSRPSLPSVEITKESLIEQFLNSGTNVNTNDNDESNERQFPGQDVDIENVSEKSLRKQERRIEKLLNLASSMSEDESFVEVQNRKNKYKCDGYTSDHCYTSSRSRSSSKLDGYISAPEYSHNGRQKPVQVVKGTVRKQQSFDDHIKPRLDNEINDKKSNTSRRESTQVDLVRVKKESLDKAQMSFGKFSSIRENVDTSSTTTTTGKPRSQSLGSETTKPSSEQSTPSDNKDKLRNLNHIITVSPIPNFSVAKKPSLNQFAQSQPIKPNRLAIKSNENNSSLDATDSPCSPRFERSYSREDTISLVSAYDSDAYESDAHSSFGTSPALGRAQRRPQRLRYRWSTVYEEVEEKKDPKSDKHGSTSKDSKRRETVVDNEAKPARIITSPKSPTRYQHSTNSSKLSLMSRLTKSPKTEKKGSSSHSDTPKGSKKYFSSSKSEPAMSPKSKGKFSLLSPRSERKNKTVHSPDKRMSGCSDASSGIDSGIQSQTSSLKSGEEIKVDDRIIVAEKELHSTKHRLWPFRRSKSRKSSRSLSGYMSDSHVTESSRRRSRLFGSRSSKGSFNTEGYCSGYETSVTEGGMTSCAEDYTDTESVSGSKKKKRFLGFRRRSTNDLSQSRARVKKPIWFDNRRCQSDDEGMQITKVYHIDEPREVTHDKRRTKSEDVVSPRSAKKIDGLRKHREHLKSEIRLALDKFPTIDYNAQLSKLHLTALHPEPHDPRVVNYQPAEMYDERQYAANLERENAMMGKKLKVIRNHIQVVTCFDGSSRKVTQI